MEGANILSVIPAMSAHPFLFYGSAPQICRERRSAVFYRCILSALLPCSFGLPIAQRKQKLVSRGTAIQTERRFVVRVEVLARSGLSLSDHLLGFDPPVLLE